jgi:hypothetical protein
MASTPSLAPGGDALFHVQLGGSLDGGRVFAAANADRATSSGTIRTSANLANLANLEWSGEKQKIGRARGMSGRQSKPRARVDERRIAASRDTADPRPRIRRRYQDRDRAITFRASPSIHGITS